MREFSLSPGVRAPCLSGVFAQIHWWVETSLFLRSGGRKARRAAARKGPARALSGRKGVLSVERLQYSLVLRQQIVHQRTGLIELAFRGRYLYILAQVGKRHGAD